MKFCAECGTLLDISTKTGELKFICPQCFTERNAQPEDTMLGVFLTNDDGPSIHLETIIKNAWHVPCIQKLYYDCPKCGNNILAFVRTKDTMARIIICKCGFYQG